MSLIVKRPWTKQPQVAAALNPALRKPTAVWLGSSPSVNLVGSIPVVNSNIGIGPSLVGVAGKSATSSTANSIQLTPTRDLIFPGGAATIAVLRRKTDTTARVATVFGNNAANRILLHAPYSDGNVYWDFGNDTTGRLSVAFGAITTDWEAIVVVAGPTKGREIWRNKNRLAADTSKTFVPASGTTPWYLFSTGADVSDVEEKALVVITASEWTDAEIRSWVDNPWAATFAPLPRRIWAPVASGVVTHATSGALTGDPATLSGTAAHIAVHGSTGALSGAGSTLAGTAAHIVVHSSTGALAGAGATAAGTAARLRAMASSGALAGAGATLAGTAARLRAMATSGALVGGGATITGAAARAAAGVHDASGSLSAGGAALAGTAARIAPHATTGALAGAGATLAGTAAHVATHTTTGALVGAAAIVAGTAAHKVVHAVNGILVGGGAALTGMSSRPAPASVSVSSAIGGPASSLFAELRGEVQYPSTRAAQANWERFISSVKPTRID